MAFQDFGPAWIPFIWPPNVTANLLLDADGEKAAFVFPAPASGDITGIEFMTGTVTTGDTLLISLQNVDSSTGHADETADQSVTQVVADANDNTKFAVTFGAARTVIAGDLIAIVFEFNSYVAGNLNIRCCVNNTSIVVGKHNSTYTALKTGGSWTKSTANIGLASLNYGGTYYPTDSLQVPTNSAASFGSGSTPDEYALLFNSPVPLKVSGMAAYGNFSQPADLVLYDSDGSTALITRSLDTDFRNIANTAIQQAYFPAVTLTKNTTYRAAVKPTTASAIALQTIDVTSAAILAQLGCGTGCHLSTRADAGSWSETTTQRPGIFLLASAFDDGAGGGSGGGERPTLLGGILQ